MLSPTEPKQTLWEYSQSNYFGSGSTLGQVLGVNLLDFRTRLGRIYNFHYRCTPRVPIIICGSTPRVTILVLWELIYQIYIFGQYHSQYQIFNCFGSTPTSTLPLLWECSGFLKTQHFLFCHLRRYSWQYGGCS